ncbi:hypothetical protein AB0H82_30020 [Streptomyces sp. NPDC050732]|uniref:hypothetical protein n=1 Tax=Streptomyces sp. NPDC050732 TaxID=3154632 RepID=UPI00341285E3
MEELIGLGVRAAKGAGAAVLGVVDALTSGPLTPVGSNAPKADDENEDEDGKGEKTGQGS